MFEKVEALEGRQRVDIIKKYKGVRKLCEHEASRMYATRSSERQPTYKQQARPQLEENQLWTIFECAIEGVSCLRFNLATGRFKVIVITSLELSVLYIHITIYKSRVNEPSHSTSPDASSPESSRL